MSNDKFDDISSAEPFAPSTEERLDEIDMQADIEAAAKYALRMISDRGKSAEFAIREGMSAFELPTSKFADVLGRVEHLLNSSRSSNALLGTLRDQFAMAIAIGKLAGLEPDHKLYDSTSIMNFARYCYEFADEMIDARRD